ETEQFITGSLAPPELAPPPSQQSEAQETPDAAQESSEPQPLLQAIEPSSEAQRREIPLAGQIDEFDPDSEGIAENAFEQSLENAADAEEFIDGEAEEGDHNALASPESAPQPYQPPSSVTASEAVPSPRP